jgi:hypothetical protein
MPRRESRQTVARHDRLSLHFHSRSSILRFLAVALVDMPVVDSMKVTVVLVVDMAVMLHGLMAAGRMMVVFMGRMGPAWLAHDVFARVGVFHDRSPFTQARRAPPQL